MPALVNAALAVESLWRGVSESSELAEDGVSIADRTIGEGRLGDVAAEWDEGEAGDCGICTLSGAGSGAA